MIEDVQPAPNGFPTLFIPYDRLIDIAAQHGRSRQTVETVIRGFTVFPDDLVAENRIVFRPKQESRAYRRGFFLFPHATGPHLAFSKAMAQEGVIQLGTSVCYQRLPREWVTPATEAGLSELSNAAGRWFERIVTENLASLGFIGRRAKYAVGSASSSIPIPPTVGELDFLGFHPGERTLVLLEAKMVRSGLEAAFWRNDIADFLRGDQSHSAKFRRKVAWVGEHRTEIAAVLGAPNPVHFRFALITLYPCIASEMISDYPCVSLTEFVLDYRHAGRWPYVTANES